MHMQLSLLMNLLFRKTRIWGAKAIGSFEEEKNSLSFHFLFPSFQFPSLSLPFSSLCSQLFNFGTQQLIVVLIKPQSSK